jgi:RHS repeat-associated protein
LTSLTQGTATVTLAYDDANRRASLTLPNGVVATYGYSTRDELTSVTFMKDSTTLGTLTYTYDAAGRRATVGGTWARTGLPGAVASATYDDANRQLTWGGQSFTYDDNGNLTGDGTNTYSWDARNRLASITGGVAAAFAYDPLGRRTRKIISGQATDFLYDGDNPVQELSGGTVLANLLTGLGIDEYFTRTDGSGRRTLLGDALGSILALTDDAGVVQTSYTYEPFGNTTVTGSANGNSLQYTGRENDGTGLYYYRARYYHPGLQRFVSEDPIRFADGDVNLYAYVLNAPTVYIDPLGLVTMPAPGPPIPLQGFGVPRVGRRHKGIDLRSRTGTCIVASDAGTIVKINDESSRGPGGNEIVMRTTAGDTVLYSHTVPLPGLHPGSFIQEGQGIGRSDYGSGTAANRPHLHYGWWPRGEADYVDPAPHLSGASAYPGEAACPPSMAGRK